MKKIALLLLIISISKTVVFASLQLEDVVTPKEQFYRLGTTDTPEIKTDYDVKPVIQPIVQKENTIKSSQYLTYADLSIKKWR